MSLPSMQKGGVSELTSAGVSGIVRSVFPTASLIGVGSGLELRQPRRFAGYLSADWRHSSDAASSQ